MKDLILIIDSGGILGVFGAGVLTAFQKAKIYNRIYAVYASSAGAHDAAYFLAKQSKIGSPIYYEDLVDKHFIRPNYRFKYIKDLILNKFNEKRKIHDIINLDYLIRLEKNKKVLNLKKLQSQGIPFYIKVFNIKSLKFEYLDGKKDTLNVLRASSTDSPYYSKSVRINKSKYIDGSVIESKNFLDIISKNKNKKIVYIMNHEKDLRYLLKYRIKYFFLDFLAFFLLFGFKASFLREISALNYIRPKELYKYSNVLLIKNDKNNNIICTSKSELIELYKYGIKRGNETAKKLMNR